MAKAVPLRQRLQREHLEAVDQFTALAAAVSAPQWPAEPVPGKWSPAHVTDHVVLAYEALLREIREGTPMRVRTTWWQRIFLRSFWLPRILRTGRIPAGVRAPRELRPEGEPREQAESIARLRDAALRVDRELERLGRSVRVTHPYFGTLRGLDVLRFCAIHTSHHAKQLAPSTDDG
ncbi:MAG: DinB family protein [Acidobacteriota bacterium]